MDYFDSYFMPGSGSDSWAGQNTGKYFLANILGGVMSSYQEGGMFFKGAVRRYLGGKVINGVRYRGRRYGIGGRITSPSGQVSYIGGPRVGASATEIEAHYKGVQRLEAAGFKAAKNKVVGAKRLGRLFALDMAVMLFDIGASLVRPGITRIQQRDRAGLINEMYQDSAAAYTQRARAIQAIHQSQMSLRPVLGNEAQYLHQ